jgi:fermentation-respiration switch protein FrsA (DUF1100 family)
MPVRRSLPLLIVILGLVAIAGCLGAGGPPGYTVDAEGVLSLPAAEPVYAESTVDQTGDVTVSRLVFHNPDGDVYALLAAPEDPDAAVVFAPGAGVTKEAHRERAVEYATAGVAFLVLDIRGNGGESAGVPLDFGREFERFGKGEWPQYYRIVQDLVLAREMLGDRFAIPVYAMGSSNGGRYAAIAAALDPGCAGYIGVSTAGYLFGPPEGVYPDDLIRFFDSVNPDTYIAGISPRPVWIHHSPADGVIPYADGLALFNRAREPKDFTAFNGTHGITAEVDERVIADVLTFNAR